MTLRERFPVLSRLAYLNSGTDGPVPEAAAAAARAALEDQRDGGRHLPHLHARVAEMTALRGAYARVLGCDPADVALTTSTSQGIARAIAGMGLGPGDEILSAHDEHPGLMGPVLAQRARGVRVRLAPLARIAEAVTPATTVVACSHVSWTTGELVDPGVAQLGVPVVLDGAQAAGAIPLDVGALRCAAYAASGQKWLCGADGSGMLYLAPAFRERLTALGPAYFNFADASRGWDSTLHDDARRFDTPALSRETAAFSHAAAAVLEEAGWEEVHRRGAALAARLAGRLGEHGRVVAPRGATTLVSWEEPDPAAAVERLEAAGVIVRSLPATAYVRASVGAWNDESDLERLLAAL